MTDNTHIPSALVGQIDAWVKLDSDGNVTDSHIPPLPTPPVDQTVNDPTMMASEPIVLTSEMMVRMNLQFTKGMAFCSCAGCVQKASCQCEACQEGRLDDCPIDCERCPRPPPIDWSTMPTWPQDPQTRVPSREDRSRAAPRFALKHMERRCCCTPCVRFANCECEACQAGDPVGCALSRCDAGTRAPNCQRLISFDETPDDDTQLNDGDFWPDPDCQCSSCQADDPFNCTQVVIKKEVPSLPTGDESQPVNCDPRSGACFAYPCPCWNETVLTRPRH